MSNTPVPVLYSFRRCPYAMRARLAIRLNQVQVELREVVLKDKPQALFDASAKGTVPVLVLADGKVVDESLDIMLWAYEQSLGKDTAKQWLAQRKEMLALIDLQDSEFKPWLDKYKYADRHPELDQTGYRTHAEEFISQLEKKLASQAFLFGEQPDLADYGIFPFIRQFASVDKPWFASAPYPNTRRWLDNLVSSKLFHSIMQKYPQWEKEQQISIF